MSEGGFGEEKWGSSRNGKRPIMIIKVGLTKDARFLSGEVAKWFGLQWFLSV